MRVNSDNLEWRLFFKYLVVIFNEVLFITKNDNLEFLFLRSLDMLEIYLERNVRL